MLCQNCGKNEATTHIKRIINGDATESHLCSECAAATGGIDFFSDIGLSLNDFFGGFLSDSAPALSPSQGSGTVRCQKCGCSWQDISREGKVGCSDCYRTFYNKLLPALKRIHGRVHHDGKALSQPEPNPEVLRKQKIESLKEELKKAIDEQRFEDAAKLRDEIKEEESK